MVDTTSNIPLIGGNPSQQNGIDWTAIANYAKQQAANTQQGIHANPISGVAKQASGALTGAVGKVGTALDNFGYDSLGIGSKVAGGTGNLTSGAFGINTAGAAPGIDSEFANGLAGNTGTAAESISGGLGTLAGGALTGVGIGGLISKWTGGSQTGGMIGGGLGGAIGALSGISSGITMGATLGSVVPGLGTVLGAAAGSLIGGMFGNKTPHPAGGFFGGTVGADGSVSGYNSSGKHVDSSFGSGLANDFQTYLQSQSKKYGIQYTNPVQVSGSYDVSGQGGSAATPYLLGIGGKDNGQTFYYGNDPDSKNKAYEKAWNSIVQSQGMDPTQLTPVYPTNASEIRVAKQTGPSDWDNFIAQYRAAHNQQE